MDFGSIIGEVKGQNQSQAETVLIPVVFAKQNKQNKKGETIEMSVSGYVSRSISGPEELEQAIADVAEKYELRIYYKKAWESKKGSSIFG